MMSGRKECNCSDKEYQKRFCEILNEMICEMTCAQCNNSISHNMIVQMIPHHKAAIEMSRNILQCTRFEPVCEIASNIIEEQTKSICNMEKVLHRCSRHCNSTRARRLYQDRFHSITQRMFSEMKNACVDDRIEADFLRQMIPHHQGAIRMSQNALRFSICPELVPILKSIIVSQRAGIQKMECVLQHLC